MRTRTTRSERASLRSAALTHDLEALDIASGDIVALIDDFEEVAKQLEDARDQLQKMTIELGSIPRSDARR